MQVWPPEQIGRYWERTLPVASHRCYPAAAAAPAANSMAWVRADFAQCSTHGMADHSLDHSKPAAVMCMASTAAARIHLGG